MALERFAAKPALSLAVAGEVWVTEIMAGLCDGVIALAVAHDVEERRHLGD